MIEAVTAAFRAAGSVVSMPSTSIGRVGSMMGSYGIAVYTREMLACRLSARSFTSGGGACCKMLGEVVAWSLLEWVSGTMALPQGSSRGAAAFSFSVPSSRCSSMMVGRAGGGLASGCSGGAGTAGRKRRGGPSFSYNSISRFRRLLLTLEGGREKDGRGEGWRAVGGCGGGGAEGRVGKGGG